MKRYANNRVSNLVSGHSLNRSFRGVFILSMVVLTITMSASLALAEDGKIYPGSLCVRYAGTSTPSYNFSAIGNPSNSSWLYLDCPVIHDSINGSIHDGWVDTIDSHYSSDVRCSLNSFYRSGSSWYGWWSPNRHSSGSGSHKQRLYYSGLGSNSSSHQYLSCRIPPRYSGNTSYIISYRVDENN
jgi:hypothetical protein